MQNRNGCFLRLRIAVTEASRSQHERPWPRKLFLNNAHLAAKADRLAWLCVFVLRFRKGVLTAFGSIALALSVLTSRIGRESDDNHMTRNELIFEENSQKGYIVLI
jgi:hypothetical protein